MQRDTRTVEITFRGETRAVEIFSFNGFQGENTATVKDFVATIGRGSAKYPASATLWRVREDRPARRGETVVVDSEGQEWIFATNVVVRNRQARLTGWIEETTNLADQTRK